MKYIRAVGVNGCINIPVKLFDDIRRTSIRNKLFLIRQKDLLLTEDEIENHVLWPVINSLHTEILSEIRKVAVDLELTEES